MLLTGKVAWVGIAFLLLATGISGPRPMPLPAAVHLSKEVPSVPHPNDVSSLQQILVGKGYFSGKVDGVSGLRTRASIRAYQKVEKLPITGELDKQTADRLGLRPEVRAEMSLAATQDKPQAGIRSYKGSGRARKTLQKPVRK